VLLLAVLIPATLVGARSGDFRFLAWPGYLWLGLMFYLLVMLLLLEVPRLVVRLWWRLRRPAPAAAAPVAVLAGSGDSRRGGAARFSAAPTDTADVPDADTDTVVTGTAVDGTARSGGVDRRLVLARGAAIVAGLTATGTTGYGVRTALGGPRLDRVQIALAKLPRTMDGTRLAVVADIHLGPLTGKNHTRRIVDMINSIDPDVVAIVGDLVDGTVAELGPGAAALADIRSRYGAYFVTGNHEYYSGYQQWLTEVARLGIRPLRNERVEIRARGGVLDLAGVNDIGGGAYGDAPDFGKALDGRDPARPVVLMAHQPLQAFEAARHGVDLQVSGHTHGGQMAPFNLLVPLQQPVTRGWGEVDGVPVYVTNGAGFWGPPVRVGAPPQVSLIELRAR
jgi:predicted MPP superfamily phosphohydrolase